MKTPLAILLSFVMTEAPVLAIHGGYTLGGSIQLMGTYAGVLVPTSDTLLQTGSGSQQVATGLGSNALGLFTLGLPQTGIGGGTVYLFSQAQQLTGSIQALPDPQNQGTIIGILTATGQVTTASFSNIFFGNATQSQITGDASGGITAAVSEGTVSTSPYGINLTGTANVTISTTGTSTTNTLTPSESIVFAVEGFLQSYADTITTTGT